MPPFRPTWREPAPVREVKSRRASSRSVLFLLDDQGVFDAPLETVWRYFESPGDHRVAHLHQNSRLEMLREGSFLASWEQEVDGRTVAITMRGTALHPLGFAYEVLAGPFAGSKFLNFFTPRGRSTQVTLVGQFTSATIPADELEPWVRRFFDLEFEQDLEGIRRMQARG